MMEKKASDLFMAVGSPVHLKVNGTSVPINQQNMDNGMIRSLLAEILTDADFNQLDTYHELNTGIGVQNVGRFRLSAFHQRGSISVVIRFIQNEIPSLDSLNLPNVLVDIIMEKRGLVLLVGATGSGKSTTIASMLDLRNIQRTGHILTLEDPIEYVFKNKKSIVNQREIGTDADNLHIALKNALRQAPDCILIGEIRDKDTMSAAIAYAQSGHLCLATLHANNSYHALNRIISFYPIENRPALLSDLSAALKSVISQRLIKAKVGGRIPAVEVLLNTRHISELIEKGEINEIKEAMEKSLSPGSQTFEQALYRMLSDGKITEEEALSNSDSPTNLLWLLNNAAGPTDTNRNVEKNPPSQKAHRSPNSRSMPNQQALDLYGIVNCDQVKKARAWLAAAGREVTFHDFKKEPPGKMLLEQWLKHLAWDELVNRRGTTWRQLPEDERPIDKKSAIGAMLERPTLIKRPVVSFDGQLLVGFDAALFSKTFG